MGEVAGIAFLPAGAAAQDEPPQIAWRHLAERYSVSGLPTILVGERRVVGFVRAKEMLASGPGAADPGPRETPLDGLLQVP